MLLITDLDNTLYDWVMFFTASFRAMVSSLTTIIDLPEETILEQFKEVHQKYGNSEQPFAVLELRSVQEKFGGLSREQVLKILDPALHKFNSVRKASLTLYPGVRDTLSLLRSRGVKIVGHTESVYTNSYWRLRG